MNKGEFSAQVNRVEKLLVDLGLLNERISYPNYGNLTAAHFRALSYSDILRKCYSEKLFDFRLVDDSIIQFRGTSFRPLSVSYSYYECPYLPMLTLENYLQQQLYLNQDADEYDVIRDYELIAPTKKETVTPVRYDFAPSTYIEGLHPASHIHIGHDNHLRVGTKKILKPLSFTLFIIRHYYPEKWQDFFHIRNAQEISRNVSINLEEVDTCYSLAHDMWEMRLL